MLCDLVCKKSDPLGWLVGEAGKEAGVIGNPSLNISALEITRAVR